MDSDELTRLCEALSLCNEDGEVITIERRAKDAGVQKLKQCLVGKVLTNKSIRCEGFKTTIQQIWRTIHGVKTKSLGNNTFIFQFQSPA